MLGPKGVPGPQFIRTAAATVGWEGTSMQTMMDANFPCGEGSWQPLFAHMVDGLVNQPLLSLGPEITQQPGNCGTLALLVTQTRQTNNHLLRAEKLNVTLFKVSIEVLMA